MILNLIDTLLAGEFPTVLGKIEGLTNYTYVYEMLRQKTKAPTRIISDVETEFVHEGEIPTSLLEIRKAILQEFIELKQLFEERRKV